MFDARLLYVAAFGVSAGLTGLVRRIALRRGMLDAPNERSSHAAPTPRGGGLAIVVATTAAIALLSAGGALEWRLACALGGGGIAVAAVGWLDDRRSVQPLMRLLVHFAAALWAVAWLKGLPPLLLGTQMAHPHWGGYVLAVLGIVWILNLFNFMDGIDGIAASEALFVVLAGAWLTLGGANAKGLAFVDLTLAAACGGFLVWNWPPAKIFLGDVGSGYLGYMIAVFALSAGRDDSVALWVWLILGGAFFVDATVTLLRRVARGERVHQAHRSHAYQWLARRWGSHRNVTVAVLAANLVWLLPWAVLAEMFPNLAAGSVLAALVPLALVAAFIGAGRREDGPQGH